MSNLKSFFPYFKSKNILFYNSLDLKRFDFQDLCIFFLKTNSETLDMSTILIFFFCFPYCCSKQSFFWFQSVTNEGTLVVVGYCVNLGEQLTNTIRTKVMPNILLRQWCSITHQNLILKLLTNYTNYILTCLNWESRTKRITKIYIFR